MSIRLAYLSDKPCAVCGEPSSHGYHRIQEMPTEWRCGEHQLNRIEDGYCTELERLLASRLEHSNGLIDLIEQTIKSFINTCGSDMLPVHRMCMEYLINLILITAKNRGN